MLFTLSRLKTASFLFFFICLNSVIAQTPQLSNSAPADAFPGEQVCFDLTFTNAGATGFGPYIRLVLPPDMTFDSANFLGSGMTANTIGTFPASPGNQLTDPISETQVSGPDGYTYINIIYPVGSVVTGGPDLVAQVCVDIDSASNPGVSLPISAQPVYEFGDTATGDNGSIEGVADTQNTLLILWRASKASSVAEGERAPGPTFTYDYTLTVDIAPTKTIFDIAISDVLPADLQFVSVNNITGGVNGQATATPSLVTPGGTLTVTFDNATGTGSDTDLEINYSVHIVDILDETNCNNQDVTNAATFDGEFPDNTPLPQLTADDTVTAKHLPIQKGVSGASNPGDTATFTLNFQVSDFATADSLVIVDTLPDGYTFDAHGSMNVGGAVAITPNVVGPDANGVSVITYDVGAVTGNLSPGTTGTITYTATVDQIYDTDGEQILGGDALTNSVVNTYSLTAGASGCSDGSSATTTIREVLADKIIVNPVVEYLPGDTVTFRLTLEVPSGDTDGIVIEDFFPLPVFDVTSLDLNTNLAANTDISFGPSDTFGQNPTSITVDAGENSLRIEFPEINTGTIDDDFIQIDIGITVEGDPFADNLFLTNLAQFSTVNSDPLTSSSLQPVSFRVRAPSLITSVKGISATSGDGSVSPAPGNPVDSDLNDADAGDTVTFVFTALNTGGANAYEVTVTDVTPSGLTGCSVDSVLLNGVTPVTTSGDLFTTGLILDGNIPAGDQVEITYTCTIDTNVFPRQEIVNTASVTWTSLPGETPFPAHEETATITIDQPTVVKTVDSISPNGAGADVTAGDQITYNLAITLPEGTTTGLELIDSLPAGFEYISTTVDTTGFAGSVDTSPGENVTGAILSGQNLTLTFTGSTTVTNDNNNSNDTFNVQIVARANGTSASNDGLPAAQTKSNNGAIDWTNNPGGIVGDGADIDFVEPELAITKTMSPDTNLDAGETVTITVQVDNTGTGPAYDIVVTDDLSSAGNLFDLGTGATQGTIPAGYTFNYANPNVTISADAATSLAAGASVTFTFTAVVRADVLSGSSFTNTASVAGDSQDGTVTEERSTNDSANDSVSTATVTAGKSLLSSSESWTSDTAPIVAAIGEVLTFQLVYDIPEGVTAEDATTPIVVDTLPSGFEFISGTALVRSVVDTTMTGSVYGNIPTTDTAIVPTVDGQDLEFDLGDITNNDDDGSTEQLILTYDVLVLNTNANNRTDSKTNTATFTYENAAMSPQSIVDNLSLTIGEPNLTVSKTALPASVTGGTTVTFTVTMTNTSATNVVRGWELTFSDDLPTEFQSPAITSATLSRGATDITAGASVLGQVISLDLTTLAASERYLAAGESVTLIYTATVDPTIGFEQQVTNTANAEFTSLPGANGTGAATPGAADSDTGERTGSGNNNTSGQAVNDLSGSDTATVTASRPSVTKVVADNTLQIGEVTTATITIDVPVGTTNSFVITDDLASGLNYPGTTITINTPASNFSNTNSPATSFAASTDPLVFDFGNVTNSAGTAQQITITYDVQPANVLGNQNTTNLTNTATLTYTGVSMPEPSDTATITVLEPNLTITNSITAGATGSDAGDTISYQVQVANTNASATAYRVNLETLLPPELLGANSGAGPFFTNIAITNPGNAVVLNSDGVTALGTGDASQVTTTNTGDTLTWALFDLPPSTTLTITFDAILTDTAPAGGTFTTSTFADYHSLDDGAAAGRDGSTASSDDDNNADLNNYNESDAVDLTLDATVNVQKTLDSSHADSNFAIGEDIIYELRLDIVEGVLSNAVVTDVFPTGVSFVEIVGSIQADPNISFDGPGTAVEAPAGTVTIDLGEITNTPDGNAANDFLVIDLRGRVTDIVGNADGVVRTNSASFSTDVASDGPDTQDITVVEPNLTITKVPDDATPSLGDDVTFTVTVSHSSSNADAFDVLLTDVIPAGLTYVVGSTSGQASVDETDPSAPEFDLGTITLVEISKTFSFRCSVDLDATVGSAITNTINAVYSSRPGTPAIDRSYNASGNGDVTPSTPTVIDAIKTVAISVDNGTADQVDPGDTLTYTITLTNGASTANNVVFTDTVPTNTTYVAATLSSSAGTPDDAAAPDLSVDLGTMNPSDSVTITFDVTVDGGTPAGTIIRNQGIVDSDQTVPEPTDVDGIDENGDQPTDIPVGGEPDRTNALYVPKIVSWLIDADMSGDASPGDTMRYQLLFNNIGSGDLNNITFSDTIPTGLTYIGASATLSAPGGSINVVGSAVTASFPLLGEGEFETAAFDVTIDGPLVDNNLTANTEQFTNQGTADSDETDSILTDSNLDPDDGNQPTSFIATDNGSGTPSIDVEKRWSLAVDANGDGLVNPNETVAYSIVVQNVGSAPATDVNLSDAIPANMTLVSGTVTTSRGAVVTESPVLINIGTMDPGAVVLVTFRTTVDGGTADGTIIPNQATVTGDGGINEPSDDNGTDLDGKNPTLTPVDTGGGSNVGTPTGLSKSLQATSEADSTTTNVLIGEIATFRVSFNVPAGTLDEVSLIDSLPTGLNYIAGSARLARTFDTGLLASQNPGSINTAASGVFVNLTDGTDVEIAGQDVSLFLGALTNSDNDVNAETYTLELQALVSNSAGNQAGTTLTNSASLSYLNNLGQPANLTPDTLDLTVTEPNIQIALVANPTLMLTLGGEIAYTVTITNPSGANVAGAYDLNLSDVLPAEFQNLVVDSITPTGGVAGVTDNTAGTSLDIDITSFPPDGQLVVVFTATAAGPVATGDITNTATVTWTSLPGAQGTGSATPGNSGDADGERNSAGGVNDFTASDSADVTVGELNITKSITSGGGRYAIGDTVSYQVVIGVPANQAVPNVVVSDILDEGLTYVSGTLVQNFDTNLSAGNSPADFTRTDNDPAAGQETLALNYGTVTNATAGALSLTLTYDATVDNILSNQDNQTLNNNVTIDFTNPAGGTAESLSDTTSLTVGEPSLTLTHTITSATTNLDAGDLVNFQVVVGNTGTTTAFETVLSNILPAGLENVANLQVTSATGGAETPTFTNNGGDWASSSFDVPVGGSVTITFQAALDATVIPGQTLQNTIDATYTSVDGASAGERDGSSPGSVQSNDADLNNYNLSDASQTITVADPVQIDKSFHPTPANTTYTIGESFDYRLTISLLEGSVSDLVVTDVLPDDVRFESAAVGSGNLGITSGYGGSPGQAGQTLTFDLMDVVNPSNGNTSDDFITIDITVTVLNEVANIDGAVLTNNASIDFTGPSGAVSRDYDSDAGTAGIQGLDATLVEPDVTISKTAADTQIPQNDEATFTLLLDHQTASNSDAYDLQIVDTLPAGLTYVSGSATVAPTSVAGQVITWDIAALTLAADNTSITYRAQVDPGATVGQMFTNTADLTYTSNPGANADERSYNDSDTETITVSSTTFIDAVKTVGIVVDGGTAGQVDVGDTLEYTVTLDNNGATAFNAVFNDPIPANTTYVAASLTSSVGGEDDSDPNNLVVDIGDMLDGASVVITFRVTVDPGTPTGTIIRNQGVVDSDDTVPEPTDVDGIDSNGDQPTDIPVGGFPTLAQPLYVPQTVTWEVDGDSSGDITPNDTLFYTYLVSNRGDQTLTNVTLSDSISNGLTHNGSTSIDNSGTNSLSVVGASINATIPTLAPGETVRITVGFTVDDPLLDTDATPTIETFITQAIADSNETDSTLSDGNSDPLDGLQPTQFTAVDGIAGSPALDVEKRWTQGSDADGDGLIDPSDAIAYSITLQNVGSAIAQNVQLDDPIPADTTVVAGSLTTSRGAIVTESPVSINIGDVDPGELVTIFFQVTVDPGTADGTIIPNQATASGDNFVDEPSDDNGSDSDGKNPTLTPVDTSGSGGAGAPGSLTLSLVDTTETDTTTDNLAIGEIGTFDLTVAIPPGAITEGYLTVTLPAGMTYIANSSQLARSFETGLLATADPGGINSAATDTFVSLTDGSEVEQASQTLTLFLGNLINSDNDANQETFTLRFDALLDNEAGNQDAVTPTLSGTFGYLDSFNQPASLTPATESVTVVEPALDLTLARLPSAILPIGGDVTFTLTLTNNGTADAYDISILDNLPAEYTGLSVDNIQLNGGANGSTDNSVDTDLDVLIDHIPVGGSVVITYTGTASGPIAASSVQNTATATYTSLPGAQGTGDVTPGNSGDVDGERNGSGSGPNDYSTSDIAIVIIGELGIAKNITSGSGRYAIADVVDYQVTVSLPSTGSVDNVLLDDVLAEGLTYVSGTLVLSFDPGVSGSNNPADFSRSDNTPVAGQETLSLNLGTVSNGNGSPAGVTLNYSATVDNLLVNQDNQILTNTITLTYDDPGGGAPVSESDSASLTVGEPELTLNKNATSTIVGLEAGDTVDFSIVVSNIGNTTAFETVLDDVLPVGMENVTALTVASVTGGAETPTFTNNGSDWATSAFDLPVGASVTITFTATLSNTVLPGEQLQNSVSASYSSADGTVSGERDGSDPDSLQSDDTDLNNYNVEASSPLIQVADPVAIDKRFYPTDTLTEYTIGATVGYRLRVSLLEGTTANVTVEDVLPDGLTFVDSSVGFGNVGITISGNDAAIVSGQSISFDLGDVLNPSNGDDSDDFITVDLTATVDNDAALQNGSILGNNASITYDGAGGTTTADFDADPGTAGIQPLDLTVVLPDLSLSKNPSSTDPRPGDVVLFEITLSHTLASDADAYDLVITDDIPVGLTYVVGSANPTAIVNGRQLIWNLAALTQKDGSTQFTYQARVDSNVTLGNALTNNVVATYTTLPGDEAGERTGEDGSGGLNDLITATSADVTPVAPNLDATKAASLESDNDGDGLVSPGDTLRYTVVLENSGNASAAGVLFNDALEANLTLETGSVTTTQGTVVTGNTFGDTNVAVSVGTVADGASVTISFNATIVNPLPLGVASVINQGVFTGTDVPDVPTDDPDTPEGDDPTEEPVFAAARFVVTKTDTLAVDDNSDGIANPGETIAYDLAITNIGNQAAAFSLLNDVLDPHVELVPGSVTTSNGSVVVGNNLNDTFVQVDMATILGGATVNVSFQVRVVDPLPSGVDRVANQAVVSADGVPAVLSDDPDVPGDEDPTVTPVGATPILVHSKSDALLIDADSDSQPSPGDTLRYTLTLSNVGNTAALNVSLSDIPDSNTTLVNGSVSTTQGTIVSGNAGLPPVQILVGDIAAAASVTVTFDVIINNPLDPAVTRVRNQALASGDNVPDTPSDDPDVPGDEDPTDTPVTAAPILSVSKRDALYIDVNEDGFANPGDTLVYTVAIRNTGNSVATDVVFSDTPDSNTTLAPNSVVTSRGSVLAGQDGNPPITVAVGDLNPGIEAEISFFVTVNDPLPAGVTTVANQALVSSNELPDTPSDDPDTPTADDPTVTPVGGQPLLSLSKTDALFEDADASGSASPGDTLSYVMTLVNNGTATAQNIEIVDFPDVNTELIGGSVATTLGSIISGNDGNAPIRIAIGDLAGNGASVTISFRVRVVDPLPAGITRVANQAIATSDNTPDEPSDDPDVPGDDDPTETPVDALPQLSASKTDTLVGDNDASGDVTAGDTLSYRIVIRNSGNTVASDVVFRDTPGENLTLLAGSVQTSRGSVTGGNDGSTPIIVDIGNLPVGEEAIVTFSADIADPLPFGVTEVRNQGVVVASDVPSVPTDDPDTPNVDDPTVTPVATDSKLEASKDATLFDDVDGNGITTPGDVLLYTVTVRNVGNAEATNVVFNDTPDSNTSLIAGSVQTSVGSVTNGNAGTAPITVAIGTLAANGGAAQISYRVRIADPLPAGVDTVINQGLVDSDTENDVPTDDPDLPGDEDPTEEPVTAEPILTASKTDLLFDDANGDGEVSPNDVLLYVVEIRNDGNGTATNVSFSDTIDPLTTLEAGTVQTSRGTVNTETPIDISIGDMLPGESVSISFRVRIDTPFPVDVDVVVNQGIVGSDQLPDVPTDDPEVGGDDDPTETPVTGFGAVEATKVDALFDDADLSGGPSAGDTLEYTILIVNTGTRDAPGVDLVDFPDSNTSLVVGSVTTTQGSITTGNTGGDTSIAIALGDIPGGGGMAQVTFRVTIDNPLDPGVTVVANQAVLTPDEGPAVLTDDPDVPGDDDPTETPLDGTPALVASKSATLQNDLNSDGAVNPGDSLRYEVVIRNQGSATATNVVFNDVPDSNTTLVPGSVSTSVGSITSGNAGAPPIQINIGNLNAGASVTINFDVTVNNPFPEGVDRVVNQGVITGDDTPDVVTDDPDEDGPDDPTVTPVGDEPLVIVSKTDTLLTDLDNNGFAGPGETLLYLVRVRNQGNADAEGLAFVDYPDANTSLIAGTVATTEGSVISGNDGSAPVRIAIGNLEPGEEAEISFQVLIDNPLADNVMQISNQGIVSGDNIPDTPTDDPEDPGTDDPTVTPVDTEPVLIASKRDVLTVDADSDGVFSAGDEMLYQVVIRNIGNAAATNVVFRDTPDSNTTLVANSVVTNLGSVISGNAGAPPIEVQIGTIAANASVEISFRVTINDPLPLGLPFLRNQGVISSDDVPNVLTDDPDLPGDDQPTDTPLGDAPVIVASKTDYWTDDVDGDGLITGGDVLTYVVEIYNTGNANATNVVLRDFPDSNTSLVPGRVRTDRGTITSGQDGTVPVQVELGNLAPGEVATISFDVTIVDPVPAGVDIVVNQGLVTSDNYPGVLTDDPDEEGLQDPTVTPLGDQPFLRLKKTATFLIDNDANEYPSGGDVLLYTIDITNDGDGAAINVVYTDTPDVNTDIVAGSVATSQGSVTGGQAGTPPIVISLGDLPSGGSAQMSYEVTIANPLDPNVESLINNGIASSDNHPDIGTDDPVTIGDDDTVVTPGDSPNLVSTKTDSLFTDRNGDGVASPGDTVLYQIALQNTGAVAAEAVIFTDTPDVVTSIVANSIQTSQGVVLEGQDGVPPIQIAIGEVPPNGGLVLISFLVDIDIPLPVDIAQISNQGTFTAANLSDPVVTDDPDSLDALDATPTLVFQADLQVIKTASVATVNAGESYSYDMVVSNLGPNTASSVVLVDPLPAGISFQSATTADGTCSYNPISRTLTCQLGTILVGDSKTVTLNVRSEVEGLVENEASVTAIQIDPNPDNNVDDVPVSFGPGVDIALTKTVDDPVTTINDVVVYTLTLSNAGPSTATNVVVRDNLPAELSFVSATASSGSYDDATGLWTLASMANGAVETLVLEAQVVAAGMPTNTAEVIAHDQPDIDSTPNNGDINEDDMDEVTINIDTVNGPSIDLSLTKTIDNLAPEFGDTVTYTLTLANAGPLTANNIEVTDTLPPNFAFVAATPSSGSFDDGTGVWSLASLAAGNQATLAIEGTITAIGELTNTAEVTAVDEIDIDSTPDNNDPNEDDQDGVTVFVDTLVDLVLLKEVDQTHVEINETLVYTLTLRNNGPSPATGVEVTDILPTGLRFQSYAATRGTYDDATGVWQVGNLGVDEAVQLELTTVVTDAVTSGEALQNTAVATSVEPEGNPDDNDDSAEVYIILPVPVLSPFGLLLMISALMAMTIWQRRRAKA